MVQVRAVGPFVFAFPLFQFISALKTNNTTEDVCRVNDATTQEISFARIKPCENNNSGNILRCLETGIFCVKRNITKNVTLDANCTNPEPGKSWIRWINHNKTRLDCLVRSSCAEVWSWLNIGNYVHTDDILDGVEINHGMCLKVYPTKAKLDRQPIYQEDNGAAKSSVARRRVKRLFKSEELSEKECFSSESKKILQVLMDELCHPKKASKNDGKSWLAMFAFNEYLASCKKLRKFSDFFSEAMKLVADSPEYANNLGSQRCVGVVGWHAAMLALGSGDCSSQVAKHTRAYKQQIEKNVAGFKEKAKNCDKEKQKLASDLKTENSQHEQAKEKVTALTAKNKETVEKCQKDKLNAEEKQKECESAKNKANNDKNSINSDYGKCKKDLENSLSAIKDAETKIQELNQTCLENKKANAAEETKLRNQLQSSSEEQTRLENKLSTLKTEAQKNLTALKSHEGNCKTELSNKEGQLKTCSESLEGKKGQLAKLQTQVQKNIAALQGQVKESQDALSKKNEELKTSSQALEEKKTKLLKSKKEIIEQTSLIQTLNSSKMAQKELLTRIIETAKENLNASKKETAECIAIRDEQSSRIRKLNTSLFQRKLNYSKEIEKLKHERRKDVKEVKDAHHVTVTSLKHRNNKLENAVKGNKDKINVMASKLTLFKVIDGIKFKVEDGCRSSHKMVVKALEENKAELQKRIKTLESEINRVTPCPKPSKVQCPSTPPTNALEMNNSKSASSFMLQEAKNASQFNKDHADQLRSDKVTENAETVQRNVIIVLATAVGLLIAAVVALIVKMWYHPAKESESEKDDESVEQKHTSIREASTAALSTTRETSTQKKTQSSESKLSKMGKSTLISRTESGSKITRSVSKTGKTTKRSMKTATSSTKSVKSKRSKGISKSKTAKLPRRSKSPAQIPQSSKSANPLYEARALETHQSDASAITKKGSHITKNENTAVVYDKFTRDENMP